MGKHHVISDYGEHNVRDYCKISPYYEIFPLYEVYRQMISGVYALEQERYVHGGLSLDKFLVFVTALHPHVRLTDHTRCELICASTDEALIAQRKSLKNVLAELLIMCPPVAIQGRRDGFEHLFAAFDGNNLLDLLRHPALRHNCDIFQFICEVSDDFTYEYRDPLTTASRPLLKSIHPSICQRDPKTQR
jgi:hypothetical protein